MEIFNNRELSTLFWLFVFFMWLLSKADSRSDLKNVFLAFSNKVVLIFVSIMLLYITTIVYGLYKIGFWELRDLKNTILWALTSAFVMLFRSNDASNNPYYFSKLVKDNLKLIIAFEFLVNFYSFGFWVEFITVPIVILIFMMNAFSKFDEKNKPAFVLTEKMINCYGLFVISYTIYMLIYNSSDFLNFYTLKDFSLPVVMSFLFMPYMLVVILYMEYEKIFTRLGQFVEERLISQVKFLIIIFFGSNRNLLSRWYKVNCLNSKINTLSEVVSSFKEIKKMDMDERMNEKVPFDQGWSPYEAKNYLAEKGIRSGHYNPLYDSYWHSSSNCFKFKDESPVLSNHLTYHINGTEGEAKSLILTLDINELDGSDSAKSVYLEFCRVLMNKALNENLSKDIENCIVKGWNRSIEKSGRMVSIKNKIFSGRLKDSYEVEFEIRMKDFDMP